MCAAFFDGCGTTKWLKIYLLSVLCWMCCIFLIFWKRLKIKINK